MAFEPIWPILTIGKIKTKWEGQFFRKKSKNDRFQKKVHNDFFYPTVWPDT